MKEFEKLLTEIHEWQVVTFKNADSLSKLRHLQEETEELIDSIISCPYIGPRNQMVRQEFADNFILLFGSAMSAGFDFKDITEAMREKLEICKKRKWGSPDKNGVVRHIKDTITTHVLTDLDQARDDYYNRDKLLERK